MTIKADIIKDSVSEVGKRITTFLLVYPRMIHSEVMTHRAFSRNASSSRAIPFERQLAMIEEDPAEPILWTANQKGMQGGEPLSGHELEHAQIAWQGARKSAIVHAKDLAAAGLAKQYVNRVLEPFAHITVVCTATDYANFFALRYHKAAMPEICALAKAMWEKYSTNTPATLKQGEWHLPFVDSTSKDDIYKSVARCARTSYLTHDKKEPTEEQDRDLYNRLVGAVPLHASPCEHQATPHDLPWTISGNFSGWRQFRKTLLHENITDFKGPDL